MKVLFVPHANKAHLHSMAPLAWALRTAGHEVRIAAKPDFCDAVMAVGFTPEVVGQIATEMPKLFPGWTPPRPDPLGPGERQPMPRQQDFALTDPVGRLARATWGFGLFSTDSLIDDLVRATRAFQPDLVLWDQMVYAAPVAAAAAGAVHARMMLGPDVMTQLRSVVAPEDDALRTWLEPVLARYGCSFGEEIAVGHFTVEPMPPWQWRPEGLLYVYMRAIPLNPPAMVPDWLRGEPERPRICITLGASHRDGRGSEASAAALLNAVADLDIEVVATLNAKQLSEIPQLPDNVRAVDFVPLSVLLPTCAAIVHHGGAGTFATAVEHGVPQLLIPGTHWGFQWWGPIAHANGLVDRGAGTFVADAELLTPQALAEDLKKVLGDPSFAANARRLRQENLTLPTPNEVVTTLERLVTEFRTGPRASG